MDLEAGDGRVGLLAALVFRAQACGVEIDPVRWLIANALLMLFGQRKRA